MAFRDENWNIITARQVSANNRRGVKGSYFSLVGKKIWYVEDDYKLYEGVIIQEMEGNIVRTRVIDRHINYTGWEVERDVGLNIVRFKK